MRRYQMYATSVFTSISTASAELTSRSRNVGQLRRWLRQWHDRVVTEDDSHYTVECDCHAGNEQWNDGYNNKHTDTPAPVHSFIQPEHFDPAAHTKPIIEEPVDPALYARVFSDE